MTATLTAVVEGGILRPSRPLALPEGTCVELILLTREETNSEGGSAAEILARITALSTGSGDARTSIEHDKVLYGEHRAR